MKKYNLFGSFIAIIVIALICGLFSPLNAQEKVKIDSENSASMVLLDTSCDSLDVVVSKSFSMPNFLSNNFSTYPVYYTKYQRSADDKPHITTTIEGSNDGTNWNVVDTLGAVADSAETYQYGSLDFNNKKYWYYRLKHTGAAGNRADALITTNLLFTKP